MQTKAQLRIDINPTKKVLKRQWIVKVIFHSTFIMYFGDSNKRWEEYFNEFCYRYRNDHELRSALMYSEPQFFYAEHEWVNWLKWSQEEMLSDEFAKAEKLFNPDFKQFYPALCRSLRS